MEAIAMRLPSDCVMIESDEMMYLDGGADLRDVAVSILQFGEAIVLLPVNLIRPIVGSLDKAVEAFVGTMKEDLASPNFYLAMAASVAMVGIATAITVMTTTK